MTKLWIKTILFVVAAVFFQSHAAAQVSVTAVQNMSVKNLLETYFVSQGTEIYEDATHKSTFNGSTVIASNQVGIFSNADTTGNNMPIDSGIVVVTGSCFDAQKGSYSGTESSSASPYSNGQNVSTALYSLYTQQGGNKSMNDVGCFTFYIKPYGNTVSFKYAFASEEYPDYVCSDYNDIFGLFISGPYDESGNIVSGGYNFRNIAVIPNTNIPVMINSVNGGISTGNATPCYTSYTSFFRTNTNNNCKMNGYTVELETEKAEVVAGEYYRLDIAISDIGDNSYNSAVYLKAKSLRSYSIHVEHSDNALPFVYKGCQNDTIRLVAEETADTDRVYTLEIETSLKENTDYIIYNEQGAASSTTLTIPAGDTAGYFVVSYLKDTNKAPGTTDTILFILPQVINDTFLLKGDTLTVILKESDSLTVSSLQNKIFCHNQYPLQESVQLTVTNAIYPLYVEITDSITQEVLLYDVINDASVINTFGYSLDISSPCTIVVTVSDNCARQVQRTAVYSEYPAKDTTMIGVSVCKGGSYSFNGDWITEEGIYYSTLTDVNGCDSIIKLTFTVMDKSDTVINASICADSSYNDNGFYENTAGEYTMKLTNAAGCDSTVTLNLSVLPVYNDTLFGVICENQTYNANNFNESTEGIYTQHLQSVSGCDSTVTLVLNVNPVYDTSFYDTICANQTYNKHGFSVNKPGEYTNNLKTVNNCDSTVHLYLFVNPVYDTVLSEEICSGEFFNFNGTVVNSAGTYTDSMQSISGCDSVIHLNLTVHPTFARTIKDTIYLKEEYIFNSHVLTEAGIYTDTLLTQYGCDSIVTLDLTVLFVYYDTVFAELCSPDYYLFDQDTLRDTGIYTHKYSYPESIDSVISVKLVVFPSYYDTIKAKIGQGKTYDRYGFYESETGVYEHQFNTINGCDSVVVLDLTVDSPIDIYVPNAFTPTVNDDNNVFRIYTESEDIVAESFSVFFRWGGLVWQTKDITQGWDGKYKGNYCQQGVYGWQLLYHKRGNPNKTFKKEGLVMLLF